LQCRRQQSINSTPIKATSYKTNYFQSDKTDFKDATPQKYKAATQVDRTKSIGATKKQLNFYACDDSSSSSTESGEYEPLPSTGKKVVIRVINYVK